MFNINFRKLVSILIPSFLRKNVLIAYLEVLVFPIHQIYEKLLTKKQAYYYYVTHTPQVFSLEKVLNDRFDSEERRIKIEDGDRLQKVYLNRRNSNRPIALNTIYLRSRYSNSGSDFFVRVPYTHPIFSDSTLYNQLLQTVVNYRLLSKSFSVKDISFEITNVELVKANNLIEATIEVSNPLNLNLEYSIDDDTYQSENVFSDLTETQFFFVRIVENPQIRRVYVKIDSVIVNDFYLPALSNSVKMLVPSTTNILNVSHFSNLPTRTFVDSMGMIRPKWAVYWDLSHSSFTQYGVLASQRGLAGLVIGGQVNPNPAKDGVDYQDEGYYSFTSALPYWQRCHNQYTAIGETEPWATGTLEQIYDMGIEIAQSNMLGGGDNDENNRTMRLIVMADIETGYENGSERHRVFLISGARKTRGYFVSMYGCIFQELGYTESLITGEKKMYNYPDDAGNYTGANISVDWQLNTTTTLTSKSINAEKLIDYPNILPCSEQSFYYQDVAPQGSNYPLDNAGNYVAINKFGTYAQRTVANPTALTGTAIEWQAWYCRYKLNNRRNIFMVKLLADKSSWLGRKAYSKAANGQLLPDTLSSHENRQIGRKYAFIFTLLCFVNGVDLEVWDRAIKNDGGIDTYSGVLGAIELLEQVGMINLYLDLVPEFWNTQYSLDGGLNWLKTKAINWDVSATDVLPVRITKTANKVLLVAFRPEGVEPLSFVAKTTVSGVEKRFHVGVNDWETTSYSYRNTPKNQLPASEKHYYCQVFTF